MVAVDFKGFWVFLRRSPLGTAFALSLLIHVSLYGGWFLGKHLGLWNYQATWLLEMLTGKKPPMLMAKPMPMTSPQPKIIPMTFVEVDPTLASPEPPKETAFYGAHNAVAANPDPVQSEADRPKIDGSQNKIVRLADNPKPVPFPLQPAAPPEPAEPVQPVKPLDPVPNKPESTPPKPEEREPKPPGEMAKLETRPVPDLPKPRVTELVPSPPPKPQERPRTLAAARAQNPALAGQKMAQDGGVRRRGHVALLDVKSTPFGAYDLAFIRAVEQRWFSLLDSTSFAQRAGKVVLAFNLNSDGRVTELRILENEVGEILGLLCQRSILDPSPYASWPSDMRRMIGASSREVTFTFYYN